jgi:hypothetical protein
MQRSLLFLIAFLLIGSAFFQVGASTGSNTQTSNASNQLLALERSPLSSGYISAVAWREGLLQSAAGGSSGVDPALSCSPAPCTLPNVRASEGGQPNNENPIATNPANPNDLLTGSNDYNCGSIQGFFTSSNGGKTWIHSCMSTLSGDGGDGDPGVGYSTTGEAFITGIDTGSTTAIVMEHSTNNGKTWSSPTVAVPTYFSGGLTDKDWLQIDTNANSPYKNCMYISVTQFDSSIQNSRITVSHSCNAGKTWSKPIPVEKETFYPTVSQFSDVAIAGNGTVYATWMICTAGSEYCGNTVASLMISRSNDGGNHWTKPVRIAKVHLAPDNGCCFYGQLPNTNERVSEIPATGVDASGGAHNGNVYTIMYTWTGSYMKVEVATSTTWGASWGAPVALAPSSDKHDQFFPWLSVSPDGTVGATWLDRRIDRSNLRYETFGAISTDGGTTFSTNVKIATKPSNPLDDGFGGGFMGDYTGNMWSGHVLYASWMDSRDNTNMQDYVGGYNSTA